MTNPNMHLDPTDPDFDLGPLASELINSEAPDAALEALLNELEETAAELRTELEARQGARSEAKASHLTPEQEAELQNVPHYLATNKGSWMNLFKLLREFRSEMREGGK